MDTRILGDEIKIKINVEPVDEQTLDDFDWEARLWCSPQSVVVIKKEEATPLGDGFYVLKLDTTKVGAGLLNLKVVGYIPDGDFTDGLRTTIGVITLLSIISYEG